jgi:hypothetical protein
LEASRSTLNSITGLAERLRWNAPSCRHHGVNDVVSGEGELWRVFGILLSTLATVVAFATIAIAIPGPTA